MRLRSLTRNSPQISGGIATLRGGKDYGLLIRAARNSPQISGGIATSYSELVRRFIENKNLGIALKSVVGLRRISDRRIITSYRDLQLGIALKSVVGLRPSRLRSAPAKVNFSE